MCDCTGGVNNVDDFMKFIEMIHPFVDGIGINCGCHQGTSQRHWCSSHVDPDLVAELIKTAKDKYGDSICIDTKIRIHRDINQTIDFVNKWWKRAQTR